MSGTVLTPEARHENAMALASALGLALKDAAEALDLDVAITSDLLDGTAQQIASQATTLISDSEGFRQGGEPEQNHDACGDGENLLQACQACGAAE